MQPLKETNVDVTEALFEAYKMLKSTMRPDFQCIPKRSSVTDTAKVQNFSKQKELLRNVF